MQPGQPGYRQKRSDELFAQVISKQHELENGFSLYDGSSWFHGLNKTKNTMENNYTNRKTTVSSLLEKDISRFDGVKDTHPKKTTIATALGHQVVDTYCKEIEAIRAFSPEQRRNTKNQANADYARRKSALPAVTFGGKFTSRKKAGLSRKSECMVLDLDGKDNGIDSIKEAGKMRDQLAEEPFVLAAWISPSGDGVKFLVWIGERSTEDAFADAEAHFEDITLDKACKDVSRLCFLSHDPQLKQKKGEIFELPKRKNTSEPDEKKKPKIKQSFRIEETKNHENESASFKEIQKLLGHIEPDPEYAVWIKIISAVSGLLSEEDALEVLQAWSPDYGDQTYEEKLTSGLNQCGLGTLIYYARQGGYEPSAKHSRILKETGGFFPAARGESVSDEVIESCLENGQRGDARLIEQVYKNRALYDISIQAWRYYWNGVWQRDECNQAGMEMTEGIQSMYLELAQKKENELNRNFADGNLDAKQLNSDERTNIKDALIKKAKKLNSKREIEAVVGLARSKLSVKNDQFDSNPWLFNLQNGTFDLEALELRPHCAEDYLIKQAGVRYIDEDECPRFKEFVSTVCGGDTRLTAFLKRALGYSMTGDVSADTLFFCHGGGRNGKTTLFELLAPLFGSYFLKFNVESLLSQGRGGRDNTADAEKMSLFKTRFALGTELPSHRRFNEAVVKDLTGGDKVTARALYCSPVSFSPSHKLWIFGNEKPMIGERNLGIWRRIIVIPFRHQFPAAGEKGYRDKCSVIAEMKTEYSGIFNWLLEGLIDYRKQGLNPPRTVLDAVEEYKSETDVLDEFLNEYFEKVPEGFLTNDAIWHRYCNFTKDERKAYGSKETLGRQLVARGYKKAKRSGSRGFLGLQMRPLRN